MCQLFEVKLIAGGATLRVEAATMQLDFNEADGRQLATWLAVDADAAPVRVIGPLRLTVPAGAPVVISRRGRR